VLDAVTQRRTQALTPEHLDNLWAKGRNYKKREISKTSLGSAVSQSAVDLLLQPPGGKVGHLVLSESKVAVKPMTSMEGTSKSPELRGQLPVSSHQLLTTATTSTDFLDIKQGHRSAERYEGLPFDTSEGGDQRLPGIGFSLHDTDEEELQAPLHISGDLQQVPSISSSSWLPIMEGTSNQHETVAKAQNSSSFSNNQERLASGQQRYRRAKMHSSHRRSRSDEGGLEKWHELKGGSHEEEAAAILSSVKPTTTAMSVIPHLENVVNRAHSEDESEMPPRPKTGVPTTVFTSRMSLNKLYCKARLCTDPKPIFSED
jgi:sorting nexin-13